MKIANIFPTSAFMQIQTGDTFPVIQPYEMYLSHEVLKQPNAYSYVCKRPSFRIVDNSAYELMYLEGLEHAISMKDTLEAARIINADEIVLTDCPFDCVRSAARTRQAALQLKSMGWNGKMMAVVHGKDLEEVCACVEKVVRIPGVTTIGIPKYVEDYFAGGTGRIVVAKYIAQNFSSFGFQVHFLGLKTGMIEFVNMPKNLVRSCDTSYFFNLARRKKAVLTPADVWEPREPGDEMTDFDGVVDMKVLNETVATVGAVLGGL